MEGCYYGKWGGMQVERKHTGINQAMRSWRRAMASAAMVSFTGSFANHVLATCFRDSPDRIISNRNLPRSPMSLNKCWASFDFVQFSKVGCFMSLKPQFSHLTTWSKTDNFTMAKTISTLSYKWFAKLRWKAPCLWLGFRRRSLFPNSVHRIQNCCSHSQMSEHEKLPHSSGLHSIYMSISAIPASDKNVSLKNLITHLTMWSNGDHIHTNALLKHRSSFRAAPFVNLGFNPFADDPRISCQDLYLTTAKSAVQHELTQKMFLQHKARGKVFILVERKRIEAGATL